MRHRVTFRLWMAVGLVVWPWASASAEAQTLVINPTRVAFTVSADHNRTVTLAGDSIPLVTRYDLEVYLPGAAQPMTTSDLGKPAAQDNAEVVIDRAAVFVALPVGAYEATVAAVGPGGVGRGTRTPPFGRLTAPAPPPAASVRP